MCQAALAEADLLKQLTDGYETTPLIPDWRTIPYPPNYSGPKLEEGEKVTDEFVSKLIDYEKSLGDLEVIPQRYIINEYNQLNS